MTLKQFLNKYLKEYVLPKFEKEGLTDISIYGIRKPSESIGQIFIDTEPAIRQSPNQRKRSERLLELNLLEEIETGMSLFGEDYYDYTFLFNKRPLVPLDEEKLPFKEKSNGKTKIRLFSENVGNEELKWHFDEEDRKVKVLHKTNWMIQMDNKLPEKLIEGKTYFIPKGIYHRVIKGSGDLKVEIRLD